jgi:cell division protein FtsL
MAEDKTTFEEKARAWITPVLMGVTTFFIVQVYYTMQELQSNMQLLLIKEAASTQRIERLEEDVKKLDRTTERLESEIEQFYRSSLKR